MTRELLRAELHREQGGLCALCRAPMQVSGVTIDHVLPIALGGTSARGNLQAAHRRCNQFKSDITHATSFCWRCKQAVVGRGNIDAHWLARHEDRASARRFGPMADGLRRWEVVNRVPPTGPYLPLGAGS